MGFRDVFNWRNGAILGLALALLFSVRSCRDNAANYDASAAYLASLNDTITYLKNGIAQKPAVEVTPEMFEAIVAQNRTLQKALDDAKLKGKNVQTVTQIVNKISIDTILVAFKDTIPCDNFPPIPFGVDSQYYSIAGLVKKSGIVFTTINFPDSISIITATKPHLFKKNEFLVSVGHSNPLIKTIGLTNLTVTEQRKWWRSGWIRGLVGFAGGIYVSQKILK